jgi:N-acetylneuraminic acid mutarotase
VAGTLAQSFLGLGFSLLLAVSAQARTLSPLPVPHSNNAVAKLTLNGHVHFYSFMGLTAGKTYADISKQAFEYDVTSRHWRALPDVPVAQGRLASTAVTVKGFVYLFGGYTVAADRAEHSTSEVFAFDPKTSTYKSRAPIPVPVDDSVALPFNDRYVYLVGGWHEKDNVALVQVYDTIKDRWFQATNWPGQPVFGHSGGIVGNRMVVADGVTTATDEAGKHHFKLTGDVWMGTINPRRPIEVEWRRLSPHRGAPLYRMAATGISQGSLIVFAGGSETAYNYDGMGYDGTQAKPSARVFGFDLRHNRWVGLGNLPAPSMDHRGLLEANGTFFIVGGLGSERQVIGNVTSFTIAPRKEGRP